MLNVSVHHQPEILIQDRDTIQNELLKELRGLTQALSDNADAAMQNVYPEGYVFMNAIYALAWTSFLRHEEHTDYFAEGYAEIRNAAAKIASDTGRLPFSEDLPLPYGAFYIGWSTYVLGSKLGLESADMRDEQEVSQFRHSCEQIAGVIRQTTYPESYHGAAWPADVMLCAASLSLHDRLFEPRYAGLIRDWLQEVKKRLDQRGMLPHAVFPQDGRVAADARGSSMALMLLFLHAIDSQFAQEQFVLFKENFLDSKLGLTGICEYPKSDSGNGDIDSGPVVLGFGAAATIVGMQTLALFGEDELSIVVRNGVEALALPVESDGSKHYLFGAVPVADAFITWSHSGLKHQSKSPDLFFVFHVFSLLIVALLSVLFWMAVPRQFHRFDLTT